MGGTGASRRWRETHWHPPRHTRHVWIDFGGDLPPLQGLVLDRRRHSYKWAALVVFVDEHHDPAVTVQQWIPYDQLRPVRPSKLDMPTRGGRPEPH